MKMLKIICLLIFLSALSVSAQTEFTGKVVDDHGEPLSSVIIKRYTQGHDNCESFAVECVYCSKSLKSGTSYFSLLSDFGSVIFYNQGCLKFQQILARTGPESEILFERFEKKLSEKVDDPLLNGNILYWELLCMNYKTT